MNRPLWATLPSCLRRTQILARLVVACGRSTPMGRFTCPITSPAITTVCNLFLNCICYDHSLCKSFKKTSYMLYARLTSALSTNMAVVWDCKEMELFFWCFCLLLWNCLQQRPVSWASLSVGCSRLPPPPASALRAAAMRETTCTSSLKTGMCYIYDCFKKAPLEYYCIVY